jgi:chemotaxis protein MotB
MRFFWAKKGSEEITDTSSWTLPYSDMMTLLMAVFVMIAAMGELRKDGRFRLVGSAVRRGFGFAVADNAAGGVNGSPRRPTLIERMERAGLSSGGRSLSQPVDPELSACCEVITGKDQVVIQVAGTAAFERFGAGVLPQARLLIGRVSEFLADGQARLEVRGHGGDGPLPRQEAFRDAMDLSYARARAVADLLVASGVPSERVYITACGDQEPLTTAAEDPGTAANRRIEIIVHTAGTAGHVSVIAEKEKAENG